MTTDGVAGDTVVQEPCTGGYSQRWFTQISPGSGIGAPIKNPASGLYLDVYQASGSAGASIDVWYFNGGTNQSFGAF